MNGNEVKQNLNRKAMKKWIVSACFLMMQASIWGKVTLPDILSDNMVLQQQTEACLWGKANAECGNKRFVLRGDMRCIR